MATPGPTSHANAEKLAGSLLRLARIERGWTQRQLAEAAGVPVSTVGRIEAGLRQPSLVTLFRLLAAADLEMRTRIEPYDNHDDVLDARRAMLSEEDRAEQDLDFARTTELLHAAGRAGRSRGAAKRAATGGVVVG